MTRNGQVLSAINAAEVVDQLVRVSDRDPDDGHADLAVPSYPALAAWSARKGIR